MRADASARRVALVFAAAVAVVVWDVYAVHVRIDAVRQEVAAIVARPHDLETAVGRARAHERADHAAAQVRVVRRSLVGRAFALVSPAARRLGADASAAVTIAQRVLEDVDTAEPGTSLQRRVPVDRLDRLAQRLREHASELRALTRHAASPWPAQHVRGAVDGEVRKSADHLDQATRGVTLLHALLGGDGERRYLVGFLNNAEMRDSGMMLSYAVATARDGTVRFERTGPIDELRVSRAVDVPMSAGSTALFADFFPTLEWRSVNATADFAWTGRTAVAMYEQATGQTVDGFVGVDVRALVDLLKVIGPVDFNGSRITANNAVSTLLRDAYATDDQAGRRDRLADLAARVMTELTSGRHGVLEIGSALGDAAASGHVRMWSGRADEERTLEEFGLGGAPASSAADPTFHVAVENATSSKLDYYVRPSYAIRSTVERSGIATVRIRVTLHNSAPPGAAPSYVLGPDGVNSSRPGEYLARVIAWGPTGSMGTGAVAESGLEARAVFVRVQPGQTATAEFVATVRHAVRAGHLRLRLVPQARLFDAPIHVIATAAGRPLKLAHRPPPRFARTLTLDWKVFRDIKWPGRFHR